MCLYHNGAKVFFRKTHWIRALIQISLSKPLRLILTSCTSVQVREDVREIDVQHEINCFK